MSIRRIRGIIERLESRRTVVTDDYLIGLGDIRIGDKWYGRATYMAPFRQEELSLARQLHEALEKDDQLAVEVLVLQMSDLRETAIHQFKSDREPRRAESNT